MSSDVFEQAALLPDGPGKVAALAAWLQSLNPNQGTQPILVGGGAVELYSGGAYRTGDLDFVGTLGRDAERQLESVGFRKSGRHWIHDEHRLFLEFSGSELAEGETAAIIKFGEYAVLVIGLEELIVDRLAAWRFWNSEIDGVNAFRLVQVEPGRIDWQRLGELARAAEVTEALDALVHLVESAAVREPDPQELEDWVLTSLRGTR